MFNDSESKGEAGTSAPLTPVSSLGRREVISAISAIRADGLLPLYPGLIPRQSLSSHSDSQNTRDVTPL